MKRTRRKHHQGKLMAKTLELLEVTELTFLEIFEGTQIAPEWLSRFKCGRVPDPGVNRVETLFRFLGGNLAELDA